MATDWKAVRSEYERGATASKLAARFKCAASTVKRRAEKEGWVRPAAKRDEHKALWDGVKKKLISGLTHKDRKAGLEELKAAKVAGEVLASVIRGEKEALGAEADCDDADEVAGEIDAVTAPPGAKEALD